MPRKVKTTTERGLLHSHTLGLVQKRPRTLTLKQISKATNLPEAWLKQFGQDRIAEPSVTRVEKLYVYLSGKPLEV